MGELVVVVCAPGQARCDEVGPASPEREAAVRARIEEAQALLEPAGLWVVAPVVALDAELGGALATTMEDAARAGLVAYPGRPMIFFAGRRGRTSEGGLDGWHESVPDLDVVLHELTHVWLRAAGADDARWRLEAPQGGDGWASRRVSHESALVHEGLADFVAAALTGDPVLGEGPGAASLRVEARCPDGLTGAPHTDAVLVSGALWELGGAGRDAAALAEVVAAVRVSAVEGSRDVAALVEALGSALSARAEQAARLQGASGASSLPTRWAELVERRGLLRCGEPIAVGAERVSARAGDLLAAGTGRFPSGGGSAGVGGPLGFRAQVGGPAGHEVTAKVVVRSSEARVLAVDWRAMGAAGEVLGEGRAPLEGGPSQWAAVSLPGGSRSLDFVITTNTSHDVAYNDVRVTWEGVTPRAVSPEPAPRSGCLVGGASLELVAALVVAWVARRPLVQRLTRARTSAQR